MTGARAFRRRSSGILAAIALFGLAGCAGTPSGGGHRLAMECVPFARQVSGVELRGNAADWWAKADGRYVRTRTPAVGSVLVLRRSRRLADGHVAVVSRVLSDRRILVTHANWVRHRVDENVPVIDVSPENDWTLVRVWWPPIDAMGTTRYPAYGFIRPDRPRAPERIAAVAGQIADVSSP